MEIIIIILLILLNGLFAMSEIALISARRSSLTVSAKQGNTYAFEIVDMDGARIDRILAYETSKKANPNL